jgi:hypothetical protein
MCLWSQIELNTTYLGKLYPNFNPDFNDTFDPYELSGANGRYKIYFNADTSLSGKFKSSPDFAGGMYPGFSLKLYGASINDVLVDSQISNYSSGERSLQFTASGYFKVVVGIGFDGNGVSTNRGFGYGFVVCKNNEPKGSVYISGDAVLDSTLSVSADLSDEDGLGAITYQWYADGISIGEATESTLNLTQDQVGKVITVIATYFDNLGFHESVGSQATSRVLVVPTVSAFSPVDGATSIAVDSDITVTFNEAIQRGTGNIQIRSGSATGTVVASYDAANSENLTISGSTLTINPASDLGYSTNYFVTFDSGSIKDLAGNSYAGINTYDFTTPTKNNTTTSTQTLNDIASVGVSPDNSTLLIKFNSGELMSLPNLSGGGTVSLGGTSVSTSAIAQHTTPQAVFTSLTGGVTDYVLPELYKGGLNLKYQHIDTTPNAVVVGSTDNDFIKVADTHSLGKAVNGGGGSDVIDGGVGSTFVTGGTGHHGDTFFLDGRAPGVSWSTITDFQLGSDQATIWGFVKGVSSVDSSFANPNNEGAGGIYNGLTLHFKNLLADGLATGSNADLNSITLSGHTLADIGVSSLQDLNNKINNAQTANALGQYVVNEHIIIGQTQDALGTHSYLFLH